MLFRFFRSLRLAWLLSRKNDLDIQHLSELASIHDGLSMINGKLDGLAQELRAVKRAEDAIARMVQEEHQAHHSTS